MGRKAFQPTTEQKKLCTALAQYGVPHEQIAAQMGVSVKTLKKALREELDVGASHARAVLYQHAFKRAQKSDIFLMFYLKTRYGWRESDRAQEEKDRKIEVVFKETGQGERLTLETDED